MFTEIFDGMRNTFLKAGLQTIIETTEYDLSRESAWLNRMIAWRPAGVILTGLHHSPSLKSRLLVNKTPMLEIWDHTPDPTDLCIGINHFEAGRTMGEYLTGLGYRRPAFVGVERGRDARADLRFEGFVQAFEQGMPIPDDPD